MMTVMVIMSILVAMALDEFQTMGRRAAARDGAMQFKAALTLARSRAIERNANEWVIVYPNVNKQGTESPAGHGAFFQLEDPSQLFNTSTSPGSGELRYSTYVPAAAPGAANAANQILLEGFFMDDLQGHNAEFGLIAAKSPAYDAPFKFLTLPDANTGCSPTLCTGSPKRGAVVFGPDGSATFVDGSGNVIGTGTSTSSGRATGFAIRTVHTDLALTYLLAVSGPSGFVSYFPPIN